MKRQLSKLIKGLVAIAIALISGIFFFLTFLIVLPISAWDTNEWTMTWKDFRDICSWRRRR